MWSQKGREDITNQSVVREKLLDFFNETNMTMLVPETAAGQWLHCSER